VHGAQDSSSFILLHEHSKVIQIIYTNCPGNVHYPFHTWCGLSANLGCRSETCCTQLAENTGRKKSPKNRHLGTIAQLCRAISSQLRHISKSEKNC